MEDHTIMRLRFATLALGTLVALLALVQSAIGSGPTLSFDSQKHVFTVEFDKGAVFLHMSAKPVPPVSKEQMECLDGQDLIRGNWFLNETSTIAMIDSNSLPECKVNYAVHAEVGYPFVGLKVPGVTEVVYVSSNTVEIER